MSIGHDIGQPFDQPFFAGSGAEIDDYSLPVSIDGRGFQLDTASQEFTRRSIKLLNTQQAQTGQDYAIEPPTVWRRSTESWHSGADQARYDRADSIDTRFRRSVGIDPWTKYGIELLPDTTRLVTMTAAQTAFLTSIGTELFIAIGTDVAHYNALNDPTPTHHTLPAKVVHSTSDGENYFVLCENGDVWKRDASATWSLYYHETGLNPAKAMLAYVKGFLIMSNASDLFNITGGVRTLIYTHPMTGWWWREATEGLSVIYIIGGKGDRWHVHSMTIDKNGATLLPPIVATTLPDGEIAYTIASYMGYVLIGVSTGWRFAMPDSSGSLTYGQLVETVSAVHAFEGQGRFVWFGLTVPSAPQNDQWARKVNGRSVYAAASGLGRADLSVFIAPMTPAAASDIYTPSAYGVVSSVVTVGGPGDGLGKRVYAIDGVGVFYQADTLIASGWVDQGVFTFNSTDPKMGLYAQVFHEPLIGRITVGTAIDTDSSTFVQVGFNDVAGSVGTGNMPFPKQFNSIEMRYTLYRDTVDPTKGPRLTRAEFRAINIPGRATEWHIPLLVFEASNWENTTHNNDVVSDYDFLMELIRTRRQFVYREGNRTWDLHANDFVWTHDRLTADRASYQGTFLLVAREIT